MNNTLSNIPTTIYHLPLSQLPNPFKHSTHFTIQNDYKNGKKGYQFCNLKSINLIANHCEMIFLPFLPVNR